MNNYWENRKEKESKRKIKQLFNSSPENAYGCFTIGSLRLINETLCMKKMLEEDESFDGKITEDDLDEIIDSEGNLKQIFLSLLAIKIINKTIQDDELLKTLHSLVDKFDEKLNVTGESFFK